MSLRVFVTGQRSFGAAAFAAIAEAGYAVVGVCSPTSDGMVGSAGAPVSDRLRVAAELRGVPWVDSAELRADRIPDGTDVIVAAHSHAFVGAATRRRARLASIGYHPSALPLHRGRDAVRWTVRDGDRIAGGSVYHLTDSIDAGPLAAREFVLVPAGSTASSLWRDLLFPLGIKLLLRALRDLSAGRIVAVPQEEDLATWEPSWERAPLFRPELPRIAAPGGDGISYVADRSALGGDRG